MMIMGSLGFWGYHLAQLLDFQLRKRLALPHCLEPFVGARHDMLVVRCGSSCWKSFVTWMRVEMTIERSVLIGQKEMKMTKMLEGRASG